LHFVILPPIFIIGLAIVPAIAFFILVPDLAFPLAAVMISALVTPGFLSNPALTDFIPKEVPFLALGFTTLALTLGFSSAYLTGNGGWNLSSSTYIPEVVLLGPFLTGDFAAGFCLTPVCAFFIVFII